MSLYYIDAYEVELIKNGKIKKEDIISPERMIITGYVGEDLISDINQMNANISRKEIIELINHLSSKVDVNCSDCITEYIYSYISLKNNKK